MNNVICGIVFDTTASNTGRWRGACALIEATLGRALLWLGCRHHIYELHMKHVTETVTGVTKEPGVKLFRRLKAEWNNLSIDNSNLSKFNWTTSCESLTVIAENVLLWGLDSLKQNTFPRDDYKELVELVVVWLGGHVDNFTFKYPGADHHARWMSKAIYFLKLALLKSQFEMDDEEMKWTELLSEFVGLFYAKGFLKSALNASAARNDLDLINNMKEYASIRPEVANSCLESAMRHLWYLTPQLIVFSLCDEGLSNDIRENLARSLLKVEKPKEFEVGKPIFPDFSDGEITINENLVSEKLWLLFNLLNITDTSWMNQPIAEWNRSKAYNKLFHFVTTIRVVNDIAERGIKLITDYIAKSNDEIQRQALLQVVEYHREEFSNYNKSTLKMLDC